MDIHKNARLTFVRREQLAEKVILQGSTLNSAAAEFNVCERTAAKWPRRYRQQGPAGLTDRASRPVRSPRCTADALVQRVEQLRRQRFTGLHIAQATGLSRATVSRILRRLGLNRQRDLEPAVPVIRYEHPRPRRSAASRYQASGSVYGIAVRADGRRRGKHHRGWEYLHVAVDDHPRIAFSQVWPNITGASLLFCMLPWPITPRWAFAFAACSPTMAIARSGAFREVSAHGSAYHSPLHALH